MKFIKILFFSLLSLFLFGIVIELLLGLAFYIKDKHIDQVEVMQVRDYPYLYYLFEEGENLNKHGFKTSYSPDNKSPENFRILLLGGSVARGYEADSTIAVFLEQKLNAEFPGQKFEVINAGISAFVLQQEFILLQSIGLDYHPDMVIGIDGYNDIATQWYNRFYELEHPLPPHSWGDFRVIRDNSFRSKPYSRFAYFFKNVDRVKSFLLRKRIDANLPCNSKNAELETFRSSYQKISSDLFLYCKAYNIPYYQFIQPLKFYSNAINLETLDCREQRYAQRYTILEELAEINDFMFPLNQSIPKADEWWKDECHISNFGNNELAKEIVNTLSTDSSVIKLTHYQ